MKRLWCRIVGHRWKPGFMSGRYCERCSCATDFYSWMMSKHGQDFGWAARCKERKP